MHRALVLFTVLATAACGKAPADIPEDQTGAHAAVREHYQPLTFVRGPNLRADVSMCRTAGTPSGEGHVTITYGPDGKPKKAEVDDPVFANTHAGWCVADRFLQIAKLDPMRYGAASAEGSFNF